MSTPPTASSWDRRFAERLVRLRWPLTLLTLLATAAIAARGASRVGGLTNSVAQLGDTTTGAGAPPPIIFDPRMDVWFGAEDAAVDTWHEIEDRFVAEDYIVVSFSADPDEEFGVFAREHLARTARLTERFLTVPGVRHVRSLTYNPWIRWGHIAGDAEAEGEDGLLITDLVEGDPRDLTDEQIIERMVAVLGAERAAERLGEERVRSVLGDADFANFQGEPLLLGTIIDDSASTAAIQVQVLRPRPDSEQVAEAFDDETTAETARSLWSIQMQRGALRGIRHFLRVETGTAIPTPEFADLTAWVESLPEGEERETRLVELRDPSRNFMRAADGSLVRKMFEYEPDGAGGWIDKSNPSDVAKAPEDWQPPAAPVQFHVGGIPEFELNFEEVGMADSRYVGVMFLVIMLCLVVVFWHPIGVIAPLAVVFGSVLGMLGFAFGNGDLMNNLTMLSPNMLTAVGIADAIHLVASWAALRTRIDDKRELLIEVMRVNALPVALTSITTAIGFYSLTASDLLPMQMLGYTAGLGALIAYVLSMTLVPALLSLVPHRGRVAERTSWLSGFFSEHRARTWAGKVVRARLPILGVSAALLVAAIVGVIRIEIDSDFRDMFPDSNRTVSDFNWIESRLGGVGDLELVFHGVGSGPETPPLTREEERALSESRLAALVLAETGEVLESNSALSPAELSALEEKEAAWLASRIGVDPAFLDSLDRFERWLRAEMAIPESPVSVVTDLVSPLDILRKMNQVQDENRASSYRVPRQEDVPAEQREPRLEFDEFVEEWSRTPPQSASSLVAQYYLQYENGARPGENLSTQLSQDRTQFRMQGRVRQAPSQTHLDAFVRIEEIAQTEFPELTGGANVAGIAEMTLSGKTLLNARTMRLFSVGFVKSMSIALLMITIIIGILFRSTTLALVSLLPNVLPIVAPLSVFGLLGIPLTGPAILVSSVALGVCVDDTIHFFTKFVRGRRAGKSIDDSLVYTLTQSGGALTITTLVLMIGFATLLLSEFTPNFMMGALATVMIGLAWVADFLVTPALLSMLPSVGQSSAPAASETAAASPLPASV